MQNSPAANGNSRISEGRLCQMGFLDCDLTLVAAVLRSSIGKPQLPPEDVKLHKCMIFQHLRHWTQPC